MKKYIGFLSNKLTLRGTEIAMYDYAEHNEKILNNKSLIITRDFNLIKHEFDVSEEAYYKFNKRFNIEYYNNQQDIDKIVQKYNLTHLYIIKAGNYDNLISTKCKNLIHCVFTSKFKHGEIYSVISKLFYNKDYLLRIEYMDSPSNVKTLTILEKINQKTTKKN